METDKFFKINSKKRIALICLVAFIMFFGAFNLAHANIIAKVVEFLGNLLIQLLAKLIALVGLIVDMTVNIGDWFMRQDSILAGWQVMRDFVNMLFILLLLFVAFSTIFDVKKYSFKNLLPKLIIVAILINFSFVITKTVTEVSYFPARIFLKEITTETATLSTRLANLVMLNKIFAPPKITVESTLNQIPLFGTLYSILSGSVASAVSILSKVLLLIIIFITHALVAALLFVRIPLLATLAVISPLAFVASILPNTKKHYQDWWSKLIKWSIFPSIYFFILYFLVYFQKNVEKTFLVNSDSSALWANLSIQEVILSLMYIFILIGGLNIAHKAGTFGGKFVVNSLSGIKKATLRYTGVSSRAKGVKEAWKEKWASLEDRLKRKEDLATERMRNKLLGEADFKDKPVLLKQAEEKQKILENKLKAARNEIEEKKILDEAYKGSKITSPEGLAAWMVKAKRGDIELKELKNAMDSLSKQPFITNRLLETIREGGFSRIQADGEEIALLEMMRNENIAIPLEARRSFYSFLASDDGKKFKKKATVEDYKFGLGILREETKAGQSFKKSIQKSQIHLLGEYKAIKKGHAPGTPEYAQAKTEEIKEGIKKLSPKEVADLGSGSWADTEFQSALSKIIEEDRAINPPTKGKGEKSDSYEVRVRKFINNDQDKLKALQSILPPNPLEPIVAEVIENGRIRI